MGSFSAGGFCWLLVFLLARIILHVTSSEDADVTVTCPREGFEDEKSVVVQCVLRGWWAHNFTCPNVTNTDSNNLNVPSVQFDLIREDDDDVIVYVGASTPHGGYSELESNSSKCTPGAEWSNDVRCISQTLSSNPVNETGDQVPVQSVYQFRFRTSWVEQAGFSLRCAAGCSADARHLDYVTTDYTSCSPLKIKGTHIDKSTTYDKVSDDGSHVASTTALIAIAAVVVTAVSVIIIVVVFRKNGGDGKRRPGTKDGFVVVHDITTGDPSKATGNPPPSPGTPPKGSQPILKLPPKCSPPKDGIPYKTESPPKTGIPPKTATAKPEEAAPLQQDVSSNPHQHPYSQNGHQYRDPYSQQSNPQNGHPHRQQSDPQNGHPYPQHGHQYPQQSYPHLYPQQSHPLRNGPPSNSSPPDSYVTPRYLSEASSPPNSHSPLQQQAKDESRSNVGYVTSASALVRN